MVKHLNMEADAANNTLDIEDEDAAVEQCSWYAWSITCRQFGRQIGRQSGREIGRSIQSGVCAGFQISCTTRRLAVS